MAGMGSSNMASRPLTPNPNSSPATSSPPASSQIASSPKTFTKRNLLTSHHYRVSSTTFTKFAITCGPLAQLFFFLFLPASRLLPPIKPAFSPEKTVEHYRQNETGMKGGIALTLMTAIFWPFFVGAINGQLSRIPGINPTVLWAQCAGGCIGTVSMMIPSFFFAATIYRLDRDPAITQALSDLSWFVFSMGWPPFVAQDLAISVGILGDKRQNPLIPHWVAWVNTSMILGLFPALGVHCVYHGAVAWNGALTFWVGAAAFGNQVGLLVMYLMKAVGRRDDEDEEVVGVSSGSESNVDAEKS